jgi:hypothetical protein
MVRTSIAGIGHAQNPLQRAKYEEQWLKLNPWNAHAGVAVTCSALFTSMINVNVQTKQSNADGSMCVCLAPLPSLRPG